MANHTLNRIRGMATAQTAPRSTSGSVPLRRPAARCRYHLKKALSHVLVRRAVVAALVVALALGSASPVAAQSWVVSPASGNAEIISQLFWFTLVLAGVVFVLVEGLLIYSSLRFRRRAAVPGREPPQIHGNTRLEVMWAIVPALILISLFAISVTRLGTLGSIPQDPNAMRITVTGRQFEWQFDYAGTNTSMKDDLVLPVGRPVVFE